MSKYIDRVGWKYGKLTILRRVPKVRDSNGTSCVVYWCRCDCGAEKAISAGALRSGGTVSCGCVFRQRMRDIHRIKPYESIYNLLCRVAKTPVTLTYKQFVKVAQTKKCHYCKDDIVWFVHRTTSTSGRYNLDRKDNTKGYTLKNVVVCCPRCNIAKGATFSYEEWLEIGKTIEKFRRKHVRN